MFRNTVERHPDQLAVVADRAGAEWRLKWTFERSASVFFALDAHSGKGRPVPSKLGDNGKESTVNRSLGGSTYPC